MEEEKNDNETRNALLAKQNNLEKLIKLDQKNSSQTLFSKAHRRRLLIRDQALSTTFSWAPNPTEQSLHAFWSHVGQYYFKSLKEDDMERLELLTKGSHLENKTVTPKYTGQAPYEAFKSILTAEYKKLYEDETLSEQNYQNLKKKYYLSTVKMAKSMRGLKPSTNPPTFSYDLSTLKSAKSKGKLKGFLQEETKQLDGFLSKIESKDDNKADFLDSEIEKFSEEFKKVSKENIRNLTALKNKASKKEKPVLDINDIIGSSRARTPTKDKWSSSMRKIRDKDHVGNSHADLKEAFVLYLKDVIIRLENQQAAESIKYVVDCKKPVVSGEKFKFCVIFDEAIRSTESWIEEPVLDKLDKMREQSLFKVYKIPQKTYHSVNSQNLAGFYFCDQKVENRVMELKEKPWKDLIKKGFLEGTKGFTKEELFMKSREFAICHHCKYLFPEEFLVKCTYRSTDLKLPQSNSEYMNSLAFNGNIPKRSIWNNKRTAASFYQKRNGENVCLRAYCRLCLKQNFDTQMQEDSHKPNWICPFCSGICNCTRCLRYDTLNKLMSLFSILGGDLEVIKEESYSEKYIHGAGLEMPLDKAARKNSYYALKPTKGGGGKLGKDSKEVKGKLDVYKGHLERYQALKDLRIKLERIRILCSQVARRERMKIRLDAVKNKILEEYVDKAKSLLEAKNGKRGKPDFDFIDLEPFKLKKVKVSAGKAALAPTKGKGRVRSNLTDDLLLIKRKRGRPRKEESELMRHLEELRSPEKGKRGRKKKLDILKEYIKKTPKSIADKKKILDQKKMLVKTKTGRPRGRPRKVDKERELEQARMQESPRKRGRPPKIKPVEVNEDELYEPEVSEEEEEERQEESDEEDLDRDADEEYGELESDEYDEDDEDEGEGDEGEEGSGEEFEEEKVKRGRGRPPKNPPITRRVLDSDESSGIDEGVDEEEGSGEEFEEEEDEEEDLRPVKKRSPPKPQPKGRMIVAKRGRGRPPKNPQITRRVLNSDESSGTGSEFEESNGEEFEDEESPKRRRGRPPKNPQITRRVLDSDESSGTDEEVDEEEGSGEEFEEEKVKRGRGRPPKIPPITRRVLDSDESSGTDEQVDDEEGSEVEDGSGEFEKEEDDDEGNEEFEDDDEDEYEDEDEEEERFKLPRELQGILTHQNANQFDVFNNTLDARRVTRSLYDKKQKGKKGRKKSKRS